MPWADLVRTHMYIPHHIKEVVCDIPGGGCDFKTTYYISAQNTVVSACHCNQLANHHK